MRELRLGAEGLLVAVACVVVWACAPAASPAPQPLPAAEVVAAVPSRPIEFVISTPPGGGSDIYARFIQGIIERHQLSPQPVLPVNKEGGAGAVAFAYVFEKKADMHYIMITLNSFFTTLIAQKESLPFQYKDFTPIALLALDPFFLWVPDDSPWRTAGDFVAAAKASEITVAGTGAKQEDEILFNLIREKAGTQPFRYVAFPGGGQVAAAVAGGQVQATVNNPSEGLSLYQASPRRMRPVCALTDTSPAAGPYQGLVTCRSQGLDVGIEYFNMRAVMASPGLTPAEVKFHADLMKKVYDSEEWREFAERNVLDLKFLAGGEFQRFVDTYNQLHLDVMKQAGWVQ